MKTERDGYMVLSIRELNRILKKARVVSKERYGSVNKFSTVVLDLRFFEKRFNANEDNAKQVNILNVVG